jgi:replicative DNA helicase
MKRAELKKRVLDIVHTPAPEDMDQAYMDAPEAFKAAFSRATSSNRGAYSIEGFKALSRATGGLRPNGFSILCGPTGAGKTTLLANLWMQFRVMGLPTFTAPVENGKEDFIEMLCSIASGKSRLQLGAAEWQGIKEVNAPALFDDRRFTFSNHESRLSHLDLLTDIYHSYKTKGTKIALCDNWQFMQDFSDEKNAMAKSDKALHEMVTFSKQVPVHIFMVMHPKKTEDERVNSIFDIKGSSTSMQEAHNIWLFNRLKNDKDVPDSPLFSLTPEFCREITVGKARYNGRSTGSRIIYSLDQTCERYTEYKAV